MSPADGPPDLVDEMNLEPLQPRSTSFLIINKGLIVNVALLGSGAHAVLKKCIGRPSLNST